MVGGIDGESRDSLNQRRAQLIFKKNRDGLDREEAIELERLQALSRSRMQRDFPGSPVLDESLKKIEDHLRRGGETGGA